MRISHRTLMHLVIFLSVVGITSLDAEKTRAQTALKAVPLDDAKSIGTTITTDGSNSSDGKGSIRVSTQWPTVINLAEIADIDIEGAILVYQAKLRSQKLTGKAYLEMWCHFAGGGQYFSRGLKSYVTGDRDWTSLETIFFLKPGQNPTKVTLNLVINGRGTVWVDAVRLLRRPLR